MQWQENNWGIVRFELLSFESIFLFFMIFIMFYQIKIQLRELKPSIYRTIIVWESHSFLQLALDIIALFGFMWYHCRDFTSETNKLRIDMPFQEEDDFGMNEWYEMLDCQKANCKEIFGTRWIKKIRFSYDYGDGWEFDVSFEKTLDDLLDGKKLPKDNDPILVKYQWPNLVEDCGGIWGYDEIIKGIYADKIWLEQEEFDERREEMYTPFDPFDIPRMPAKQYLAMNK